MENSERENAPLRQFTQFRPPPVLSPTAGEAYESVAEAGPRAGEACPRSLFNRQAGAPSADVAQVLGFLERLVALRLAKRRVLRIHHRERGDVDDFLDLGAAR